AFNTENRSKKLSVHDFSVTFRPMTLWVPGKLQLAAAARQVDRSILSSTFFVADTRHTQAETDHPNL
ncbi:hypothetical protein VSO52_22245, partial [Pseudomonas fulva]|uniref:hypothetical protein n=1 Tax=Pseudomonas fulva TaxID=47880 RepID=UPI002DB70A9C